MSGPVAVPPAKTQVRRENGERKRDGRLRKRAPAELREIVASPGRPLEPSVRRELEERLGHDFSLVQIHADRDAAALTGLAGADAVAVGTEIFFADGAYRPDTTDGRRLLVHEMMHTVQLPDATTATRADREPGVVSRPTEPLELAAERAADSASEAADIGPAAGAPAWMRYATVNPAQLRIEHLDPATLVDRLVAGVLRNLRGDPADAAGRIRLQFGRLAPELESAVLERLEVRLPSAEYQRVLELAAEGAANAVNGSAADSAAPPTRQRRRLGSAADSAGTPVPVSPYAPETDEGPSSSPAEDTSSTGTPAPDEGKVPDDKTSADGESQEPAGESTTAHGAKGDDKAAEDAEAEEKDAEDKKAKEKVKDKDGKARDGEDKEDKDKDEKEKAKDGNSNRPDALQLRGVGRGARVVLDGLLITGRGVSATGSLAEVDIRHCTLVPGWSLEPHCAPTHPAEPSLLLEETRACVRIHRTVLGTIVVVADEVHTDPLDIRLTDSILDATAARREGLTGPEGRLAHVVLDIKRCTVIGNVRIHAVRLAEDSIFDGMVRIGRRAVGCMRFCYVPAGSRTPRRFHCEPDTALSGTAGPDARQLIINRVRPRFTDHRYGTPAYLQLAPSCPEDIWRGAEDRSEMGVYHHLFQPQREDDLRRRLDEFTPAGAAAGLVFVN